MPEFEFDFAAAEKEFAPEALFASSSAMDEPSIARQTARAQELNELLRYMPVTFAEAMTLQVELDAGVEDWINEKVPVTGALTPDPEAAYDFDKELTATLVNEASLIFHGFTVRGEFEDEETAATGAKVQYVFTAPAKLFNDELRGKAARKKIRAYGELDRTCIDPEFITSERSMQWLHSVAPDLMEALDGWVLNDEDTPDGGELLSLRWFDWSSYGRYLQDSFTRVCAERYVQHLLNFDDSVEYSLTAHGPIKVKYDDPSLGIEGAAILRQEALQQGALARLYGPYIRYDETAPEGMQWSAWIEAALFLAGEQDTVPPVVELDVDQCKELFSMRSFYYDR